MGLDAAEPMSSAGNATAQRALKRRWLKYRGRGARLVASKAAVPTVWRLFLVCTLALVLVLVVSARTGLATDPLALSVSLPSLRLHGTGPDDNRAAAAQSGHLLIPTDTTRVLLPSVFRNSRTDGGIVTERQRFGFVATSGDWAERFDVDQLQAGWFVDASVPRCGVAPAGTDRALIVAIWADYSIDPAWLGPQVDRHPRTLWLIGNEPDCIYQGNVVPAEYARIYHELYNYIKQRDPESRVSPGGIVQASPLRLQWLSQVLAAYQSMYQEAMPVDVWNIHNGILPEKKQGWGADIPPGIDATEGVIRDIQDNDNMAIFQQQIWAFRQWMADNGYAGYPLVVSEYGILMPELYGFGVDRVNRFMSATFDFFQNATDPELGDPYDEYRLVQRWAWFSLDVPPYNPGDNSGFNGNLFNPETEAITDFGLRFSSRAGNYPVQDTVDLAVGAAGLRPLPGPVSPTQTVTRTVLLDVHNGGNVASGSFSVTLSYNGPVSGVMHQTVSSVAPSSSVQLAFVLTDLWQGRYKVVAQIDPEDRVLESTECNNEAVSLMIVPSSISHLPLVVRGAP